MEEGSGSQVGRVAKEVDFRQTHLRTSWWRACGPPRMEKREADWVSVLVALADIILWTSLHGHRLTNLSLRLCGTSDRHSPSLSGSQEFHSAKERKLVTSLSSQCSLLILQEVAKITKMAFGIINVTIGPPSRFPQNVATDDDTS